MFLHIFLRARSRSEYVSFNTDSQTPCTILQDKKIGQAMNSCVYTFLECNQTDSESNREDFASKRICAHLHVCLQASAYIFFYGYD